MARKGPKKGTGKSGKLFNTTGQADMFEKSFEEEQEEKEKKGGECLGLKFKNDEARSRHFLDILALSAPPYYTACPNPFIAEFIKHYGNPYDPNKPYSRVSGEIHNK